MTSDQFLEKTESLKNQAPYDVIRPTIKQITTDTEHLQKCLALLQEEVNLLERATNLSEDLLTHWGMPYTLWYCLGYWNTSRSQRHSAHLVLENAAFDSLQLLRWERDRVVISAENHHRYDIAEHAQRMGYEAEIKATRRNFSAMVSALIDANKEACDEFGTLLHRAVGVANHHEKEMSKSEVGASIGLRRNEDFHTSTPF